MTSTLTDQSVPNAWDDFLVPDKPVRQPVVFDKPGRQDVIVAIMVEARVGEIPVKKFFGWLSEAIENIRINGYYDLYLLDWEWEMYHHILDAIAPDDQQARPNSAHDLTQRFLLDAEAGEIAWMHSNTGGGEPRFCQVRVCINIVRIDG